MTRRIVGVMTGSSIDGFDAALVEVEGVALDARPRLIRHHAEPLGPIAADLRAAADQRPMPAGWFTRLANAFGARHVEVIERVLAGEPAPDLIAVHGQTVYHDPPDSWQLVSPAPIGARFGCRVIHDLRQADLAAGGRGAPITPLADWLLYRTECSRAVVNLGGFANVTILPPKDHPDPLPAIAGFDVCACNHVLDGLARACLDRPYDADGVVASTGVVRDDVAGSLRDALREQTRAGRALGTGDELAAWVRRHAGGSAAADLCATAVAAIAEVVAETVNTHDVADVVVAGGGTRNRTLLGSLGRGLEPRVVALGAGGIPPEAREAAAMAVLGGLSADGVPITLPAVTGRRATTPRVTADVTS